MYFSSLCQLIYGTHSVVHCAVLCNGASLNFHPITLALCALHPMRGSVISPPSVSWEIRLPLLPVLAGIHSLEYFVLSHRVYDSAVLRRAAEVTQTKEQYNTVGCGRMLRPFAPISAWNIIVFAQMFICISEPLKSADEGWLLYLRRVNWHSIPLAINDTGWHCSLHLSHTVAFVAQSARAEKTGRKCPVESLGLLFSPLIEWEAVGFSMNMISRNTVYSHIPNHFRQEKHLLWHGI